MRGLISFHPVDPDFFDGLIEPLVAGERVNPEAFLDAAKRMRRIAWRVSAWSETIDLVLTTLDPPPPPVDGTLWDKVRARLERFDHKPDPIARILAAHLEHDLHLEGRPFLIAESSTDRVCQAVDDYLDADDDGLVDAIVVEQLMRFDRGLAGHLQPLEIEAPSPEMAYRSELLAALKSMYEMGRSTGLAGERLAGELGPLAIELHAQAVPCWIARDVEGLAGLCSAAGVEPPPILVGPRSLFSRSIEAVPGLDARLSGEMRGERDVGAWVAPPDIPELLAFLNAEGARIIREASRHGEGTTCATLLRKIRECAAYAERRGVGYLEARGVPPAGPLVPAEEQALAESL